jgi:hypothetical protein
MKLFNHFFVGFVFMINGIVNSATSSLNSSLTYDAEVYQKCLLSSSNNQMGCLICATAKGPSKEFTDIRPRHGSQKSNVSAVTSAFTQIYDSSVWSSKGGGSGHGSTESCGSTAKQVLRLIMYKYRVRSLMDAPCGGVYGSWMRTTIVRMRADLPCFRYTGVDAVASVIEKNARYFEPHSEYVSFAALDLSSSATVLPQGYDMILSRDALQHLSFKVNAILSHPM